MSSGRYLKLPKAEQHVTRQEHSISSQCHTSAREQKQAVQPLQTAAIAGGSLSMEPPVSASISASKQENQVADISGSYGECSSRSSTYACQTTDSKVELV